MKQIFAKTVFLLAALAVPVTASAKAAIEGQWKNPKGSVMVRVAPCGAAYCGTISWASSKNRDKGATPGTRVLSDLRAAGDDTYRGRAYEPKRGVSGSATIRQVGPNVMIVRGCAIAGLLCKEQRWIRVS